MHRGDFDTSAVIYGKFTTYRPSTGAAYTLAGTPALSVYKDNSTTQSTTGVTLTADFDSVTGLNHFAIDTSADGTFYSAGSFFDVVITTGTVDSVSVVGSVVASFTIRKDSSLKPTTAGRTLDVSSGGEAGVDWANVGSPTTALALTGTTIASTQKVDIETIKTQAVTAAAGVTVLASVGTAATSTAQTGDAYARLGAPAGASVSADVAAVNAKTTNLPAAPASTTNITAGTITTVTNLTNAPTAGDFTATMKTSIGTAVAASAVASVTGNVGGNVVGSVGSVTGAVGSVTGAVGSVTGLTNASIADQVWDEILSGHVVSGSTGEALGAAGAAGDPWITALPGAYSAGQAGYILGTNLDATASSRLASAGYTAPLDAAATRSAVGMASANLDTQIATLATASNLAVVAGYLDTEIAAIKAVTDALPNAGALTTIQADLDDIQTRIPAALSSGNMKVDVLALNGDTTSAANIAKTTRAIARITASGTPTTTSIPTSAITPAVTVADQLKGRILTWDADTTTAALRGQATDITANTSGGVLTVTALTTAPASGDTGSVT